MIYAFKDYPSEVLYDTEPSLEEVNENLKLISANCHGPRTGELTHDFHAARILNMCANLESTACRNTTHAFEWLVAFVCHLQRREGHTTEGCVHHLPL